MMQPDQPIDVRHDQYEGAPADPEEAKIRDAMQRLRIKIDHRVFPAWPAEKRSEFLEELRSVLNAFGVDNEAETPDFILAQMVALQLGTYARITHANRLWHGWPTLGEKLRAEIKEGAVTFDA